MKLTEGKILLMLMTSILVISIFFQFSNLNKLPKSVHPWAQTDRYALALGFLNNGFDLSKPQTFILNREFPHNFKKEHHSQVTAVNLPLHEYVVAFLMKLFNTQSIWVFRIYNLLFSLIGLGALFKIGRKLGLSLLNSTFLSFLLFSSPIFLIYQSSTLGIINTLALVWIAILLYLKFRESNQTRFFNWSILIFILATLIRSTAFISLIAILLVEILRSIQLKKIFWKELLVVLLGFGVLAAHYYYMNLHMVYHYGSVFLYYLVPAKSWADAKLILDDAINQWSFNYWSLSQYIALLLIFIGGIYAIIKKGISSRITVIVSLFGAAAFVGYFLFSIAMLTKFRDHDYYLLDTLFIPLLILIAICLKAIQQHLEISSRTMGMVTGVASIVFISQGAFALKQAMIEKPWQNTSEVIEDYQFIKAEVDQLEIEDNENVLIIGSEMAPNLPFAIIDQKGFILRWQEEKELKNVLNWDYQYLLFRKEHFFSHYYPLYPDFLNHFEIINSEHEVLIAKKSDKLFSYQAEDFIQLDDWNLLDSSAIDSINRTTENWSNINWSESNAFGVISQEQEFGLTYAKQFNTEGSEEYLLIMKGEAYTLDSLKKAELVINLNQVEEPKVLLYESTPLASFQIETNHWRSFTKYSQFKSEGKTELKVYFWNRAFERFRYKNIKLYLYQKKEAT